MNDDLERRFRFSYFRTKDYLEVDLVIEKPNRETYLIEIKSKTSVTSDDTAALKKIAPHFAGKVNAMVVSNQRQATAIDGIHCLHWSEALDLIFA